MIVKVLMENSAGDGFCAEHGLCLCVEYNGRQYLIDSGASGDFAKNAEKLGVALDTIGAAFLSHAHYDHSGGYPEFFRRNSHAKVYLQPASANRQYYKIAGPLKKYIGIPEGMLKEYSDRFVYIDNAVKLDAGIHIVPHSSEGILERARQTHMCVVIDGNVQYDDFRHEQTVVFEEPDGLVCFNSCSHSGVDIAIEEVKHAFPGRKIKAYIGGFHMMGIRGVTTCNYSREEVLAVADKLKAACDARFYSGHCTGTIAYDWLKEVLGDRLEALQSGKIFEI